MNSQFGLKHYVTIPSLCVALKRDTSTNSLRGGSTRLPIQNPGYGPGILEDSFQKMVVCDED